MRRLVPSPEPVLELACLTLLRHTLVRRSTPSPRGQRRLQPPPISANSRPTRRAVASPCLHRPAQPIFVERADRATREVSPLLLKRAPAPTATHKPILPLLQASAPQSRAPDELPRRAGDLNVDNMPRYFSSATTTAVSSVHLLYSSLAPLINRLSSRTSRP